MPSCSSWTAFVGATVKEMGKDRTQRIAETAPKALRQLLFAGVSSINGE